MTSRARQLTKIGLLLIFIASSTACTTTTKKLTTTEPRIDSAGQLAKARQAFNQHNYEQAASLLTPLAEQGNADAQYALGYLYHSGLGVPRNYKLAIQWMTAASAKGNEKATEALRRISELGSDVTDSNLQDERTEPEPESMEPIVISGKKPEITETPEPEPTPAVETADKPTESAPEPKPETEVLTEAAPAETPEPAENKTEPGTDLTDNEKWIMEQADQHFTIQLIATSDEKQMKRFINENNLSNAVYYRAMRNNKNWYTLIQGNFESPSSAREAINNLPPTLQNLKPWVKAFSDIKEALSSR